MKSKRKPTPAGELRQSQLLNTFGPGSMVDLPDHSVVIAGLNYWKGERKVIREDRLRSKVAKILEVEDIKFYTPPRQAEDANAPLSGIDAFIFPTWFLAQIDRTVKVKGKEYRTRPFLTWNAVKGGAKFEGSKVTAVPVRFVQACVNGHLDDIDWYAFVHEDFRTTCRGQLWLDEGGSGNDFEEIFVRCEACNARRPLATAKVKDSKVLGPCKGKRPWLGYGAQEPCVAHKIDDAGNIVTTDKPEYNRLLVRSASNAYFSQTLSVISLPDPDAALKKALDKFYEGELEHVPNLDILKYEFTKDRYSELSRFGAAVVWAEIERRKSGQAAPDKSIKQVELEALLACPEEMGKEALSMSSDFDARARKLDGLDQKWKPFIDRVVLVHRLREVIAQVGFTRFEASMPNIEGELDDLAINVRRAALDFESYWVPAVENKGEGVFISFPKSRVEEWVKRSAVKARGKSLEEGFLKWLDSRGIPRDKGRFPGIPYIMLHSLSHLLITAVSLECGYAASAIRERIYANETGYGILLYTGTSGSEGTLGGLVQVGRRIEQHLSRALELGRLCSNDPVCAQHEPTNPQEDRFLHGSACHGCLLIAETSCERRNEFLDRALVVNTVEELGAEFFPDDVF
ncbi:hypothetical protein BST81_23705 [Leptolyngbya sp. 'hensonii']|uniref:DUF1998 domain-containing protein n=1 Tax=Leptolyngbya sp. 'hensonii' TaxID=1922337 RepID=UPI00094F4C43|nr:DUF1998 domain-containing protein [Leptolyngbya sp. 'hensonii']OLP15934.1 hypothetical protein BST81_23705 [Leptolyngbya sp. 'hensonii']